MADVTVGGLTVQALVRDLGRGTWYAGWLPDTDGIDFSIVAKAGTDAVIAHEGRRIAGRITDADPVSCDIWVQVTGELT